jgi:crotonobetainyl-CoA:carnitine CoA-transferase CaiB-like acyl-CoA transferase
MSPTSADSARVPGNHQPPRAPLAGIKVVEVGVWHAGPGANVVLADLGAEVVKVESLRGEPERHTGKFGNMDTESLDSGDWTLIFEISNRNKQSVQLDIGSDEGKELLHKLVADADVFLTNLRRDTVGKLGIDYDTLSVINPRLVYARTTGFGPNGPIAGQGAYDTLGQAYSGMLFLAGNDEPTPLSVLVLDQMTAIATSHAIITALLSRSMTGLGQDVHVSLYSSAIWLNYANLMTTSALGMEIDLSWNRKHHGVLRSMFRCADGVWVAGTHHPEDPYWHRFCAAIQRPDLADDPRLTTRVLRADHLPELYDLLDDVFAARTSGEWLKTLGAGGLLFAPVRRFEDVLSDPQAEANDYIVNIEHPRLGAMRVPGYPVTFGKDQVVPYRAAPSLGEHTDAVLAGLGLDDEAIAGLRERKVIG